LRKGTHPFINRRCIITIRNMCVKLKMIALPLQHPYMTVSAFDILPDSR